MNNVELGGGRIPLQSWYGEFWAREMRVFIVALFHLHPIPSRLHCRLPYKTCSSLCFLPISGIRHTTTIYILLLSIFWFIFQFVGHPNWLENFLLQWSCEIGIQNASGPRWNCECEVLEQNSIIATWKDQPLSKPATTFVPFECGESNLVTISSLVYCWSTNTPRSCFLFALQISEVRIGI